MNHPPPPSPSPSPPPSVLLDGKSLTVSASINIVFAITILLFFSILKKQPSNSTIYFARRLSLNHHMAFDKTLTLSRFIPTVYWIRRAFRITDAELLENCGLDAFILIRLFKFGWIFLPFDTQTHTYIYTHISESWHICCDRYVFIRMWHPYPFTLMKICRSQWVIAKLKYHYFIPDNYILVEGLGLVMCTVDVESHLTQK